MKLPFRDAWVESSQEHQHTDGDKSGEDAIEHGVEEADLGWKIEGKMF